MLVTKEEVFERFWYLVMPIAQMLEQPKSFELLGQKLVLWSDDAGKITVDIIVNTATPINDSSSQIVQFCLRNDTEAETKAEDVVAFDCEASRRHRAVTLEDRAVLETTDYNVPLDLKQEQHMMTDKPGILMRKKLSRLIESR